MQANRLTSSGPKAMCGPTCPTLVQHIRNCIHTIIESTGLQSEAPTAVFWCANETLKVLKCLIWCLTIQISQGLLLAVLLYFLYFGDRNPIVDGCRIQALTITIAQANCSTIDDILVHQSEPHLMKKYHSPQSHRH